MPLRCYLLGFVVNSNRKIIESKSIVRIPLLNNCMPNIASYFLPFCLSGEEINSAVWR